MPSAPRTPPSCWSTSPCSPTAATACTRRSTSRRRRASCPPDFAEIVPELGPEEGDIVVTKRQWGAFYGTDLDLQLRRRGIATIVLGGIATNYGVESTARDAYERGYALVLRRGRHERAQRRRSRVCPDQDLPANRARLDEQRGAWGLSLRPSVGIGHPFGQSRAPFRRRELEVPLRSVRVHGSTFVVARPSRMHPAAGTAVICSKKMATYLVMGTWRAGRPGRLSRLGAAIKRQRREPGRWAGRTS